MTKTKKFALSLFCIFALLISVFTMMGFTTAYAATNSEYWSQEKYTDSDNLLQQDGSNSAKTIKDFSKEVKAASNNKSFPELAQVIPLQYLETTETNAVYQPYL
ncbi:MAG: hypothetical protein K2J83_05300 [Clostridia bacterium]|nr:hypothetical protein [Clostridia bacterium]